MRVGGGMAASNRHSHAPSPPPPGTAPSHRGPAVPLAVPCDAPHSSNSSVTAPALKPGYNFRLQCGERQSPRYNSPPPAVTSFLCDILQLRRPFGNSALTRAPEELRHAWSFLVASPPRHSSHCVFAAAVAAVAVVVAVVAGVFQRKLHRVQYSVLT